MLSWAPFLWTVDLGSTLTTAPGKSWTLLAVKCSGYSDKQILVLVVIFVYHVPS